MPGRRLGLALGLGQGLGQRLLLALCAAAALLLLLLTAGSWSPGRRRPSPPSPPPPPPPPPAVPDTSARSPKRDRPGCCREPSLQHGHHRSLRWHIELQPWASPQHSLEDEAARFLVYISTTQVDCSEVAERGMTDRPEEMQDPWAVCLDNTFQLAQQMQSQRCCIYSVGLRSGDRGFEEGMSMAGCEVHYLDPSVREAHLQQSQGYWHHRLALDWREPNPSTSDHHRAVSTKKLAAIMQRFGHSKIDVLKADVESAEWKILENLILENVVEDIGQLVLAVHLHWAGFEVSGSDSDVVRYWYSLLKELELRGFKLFRSYKNMSKPQVFLQREAFNASSSYTLSWVNTQWVQQ